MVDVNETGLNVATLCIIVNGLCWVPGDGRNFYLRKMEGFHSAFGYLDYGGEAHLGAWGSEVEHFIIQSQCSSDRDFFLVLANHFITVTSG